MDETRDDFLLYYEREMAYLRTMGGEFAARYPKVAGRLEVGGDDFPDPHVGRLVESFAFLTARIQQHLDGEFPQVSSGLLNILYPQFLQPVPSMTIARFEVDPTQGKLTTGHRIEKHTPLFAQTQQGLICRFRTCYPVTLWPLEVTYAGLESVDQFDFLDTATDVAAVLRLKLGCLAGSFRDLEGLTRLRFFLNVDSMMAGALYELLFGQVLRVAILPEGGGRPVFLPEGAILPVGFGPEEEVLPFPKYAHHGYRLLQEYFTFAEKFLFFDLDHLRTEHSDQTLDLLLMLRHSPRGRVAVNRDTFGLGCTPIINLFRQTTEPIRLDHRSAEYRLLPDARRDRTTEIHSILSVSSSPDRADDTRVVEPFFSFNHRSDGSEPRAFWSARRQYTGRKDLPGTELLLTFVDLDFNLAEPPAQTVYAHTLCTNRDLASLLPDGALLQTEEVAPLGRIVCLGKPTPQLHPPVGGAGLWRLISHLSLNYLSLTGGEDGLKALREILRLYSASYRPSADQQITGIRSMACRKVVRRVGDEAWRGFCRGLEISLEFDETLYVGGSAFLMGSVLNHFLAMYASVNSFTQLIIRSRQREGIWKQWPPMAGDQAVL